MEHNLFQQVFESTASPGEPRVTVLYIIYV